MFIIPEKVGCPIYKMQEHSWKGAVEDAKSDVLDFYFCVAYYHKLSNLKQHTYLI